MRGCSLLCLLATATTAQAELVQPVFQPVAVAPHVYDGGWEHFVGGGLAAFDCDGDALPEIYAAGGSNPSQLFRNRSDGDVAFEVETPKSLQISSMTGAYPVDIDSDGLLDLAILRVGDDMILQGQGDCEFAPFTDLSFTSGDHWTTAFSATWEAGQALPTLAFGTYVDRADPKGPFEACDASLLYRPKDASYAAPAALEPGFCTLSILFSDWNRSGRADLRISNDRHYYVKGGSEQMWAMEAAPRLYEGADGWDSFAFWGMGIASRDVTGDGFPEVYLTSMGDQKFQIFEGDGPTWRDATYDFGTTAHRPHTGSDGRPSTGWHAQFGDVNNDGRDDIFVTKGNVEQMPVAAMEDPNSLLMQQADGRYVESSVAAGVATLARSRGGAVMDLNGDGLLDIAVLNRRAPLEVYQNVTVTAAHWLSVTLQQKAPNRNAVGAFIEIKTPDRMITRELTVGGGHAGGQAGPEHFGLGPLAEVALRVVWPDGATTAWQTVTTNQAMTISR